MTEVPEIVHNRLRAAAGQRSSQTHPDADLLTAFAEQALPSEERDNVLEHLTRCENCREVLNLALPASKFVTPVDPHTEHVTPQVRPQPVTEFRPKALAATAQEDGSTSRFFAWPVLRWAAVAAGASLAITILLSHPGKPNHATLPSQAQISTPVSGSSQSQLASASPMQPEASPSISSSASVPLAPRHRALNHAARAGYSKPNLNKQANTSEDSSNSSNGISIEARAQAPSPTLFARNEASAIEKAKPVPAGDEFDATSSSSFQDVGSTGGVNNQNKDVQDTDGQTRSGSLIVKESSSIASTIPDVKWKVATGSLQRSADSGQSWQNVSLPGQRLICYANVGEDVWVGGEAGAIFHSVDRGLSWAQVRPASGSQRLTADIVRIEAPDPAKIVITTSSSEIWSSLDGGKNWSTN